ncbi:MAG: helix-turn-helix domain-containing protein [Dehalococcoidia bacterium]|nr:helix-turn-helix domain-containing protein [Dehalococcoidia bacterium]
MPDPAPEHWVRSLRRRSGLSQAAFARRLGVRQQTVSEWETGRYAPRGASLTVLRMLEEEIAPYDASPPDPEQEQGP